MAQPQQPLADVVREALRKVHEASRLGRAMESPGDAPATAPGDVTENEIFQFLFLEITTVEELLLRVASEVDALRES
jgi:hypothetical protein